MVEDGRGVRLSTVGEDGHKHSPGGQFLNYAPVYTGHWKAVSPPCVTTETQALSSAT